MSWLPARVEVTGVDQSRSLVRLDTRDGKSITAKHAVFCTGYEPMKFAAPKGYKVISTWALATRPQPRTLWPTKSLIREAADPYRHLRTTADGRIIAGGEDEPFSDGPAASAKAPMDFRPLARSRACRAATRCWASAATASPSACWRRSSSRGTSRASRTRTRSCSRSKAAPDEPLAAALVAFTRQPEEPPHGPQQRLTVLNRDKPARGSETPDAGREKSWPRESLPAAMRSRSGIQAARASGLTAVSASSESAASAFFSSWSVASSSFSAPLTPNSTAQHFSVP